MRFPILIAALISCKFSSSVILTNQQTTTLTSFLDDVMNCSNIPGLTLAVVKGNETWTKGFGTADIENGINVTADTRFGIASLTKAFTTTLLAMFLEESQGRLTWTSKVSDILGEEFVFSDGYRSREMTLRDLLTHRTGLLPVIMPIYAGYNRNLTRADIFRRFEYLPETRPFRDKYVYSNWPYALAGHIIEELSGESYEDTLEKRILQPLNMNNTHVLFHGKFTIESDGVAKPYIFRNNTYKLLDPILYDVYPFESAFGIVSSANDMAKWLHFILRRGKAMNNVTLVSSRILNEVFVNHQSMPTESPLAKHTFPFEEVVYGYGYGWSSSEYREHKRIHHSGMIYAHISIQPIFFDHDLGIFISTNGPGTARGIKSVFYFVSDTLIGENPWLNASTACTFPSPWIKRRPFVKRNTTATPNPPVNCTECFVGSYGHRLFGNVEVINGSKSLELHYNRLRGYLKTTSKDNIFLLDFFGPLKDGGFRRVTFGQLAHGKYKSLVIDDFYNPYKTEFKRGVRFCYC